MNETLIRLSGSLVLLISVSMPIPESRAETIRIQHYTHIGCNVGGQRYLPAGADIGLVATFRLPEERQPCLDALKRMQAGCEMATHFQGTTPDGHPWKPGEKHPLCLSVFRGEISACIGHYEFESQKCDALGSDEQRERREIEEERERIAVEEERERIAMEVEREREAKAEERQQYARAEQLGQLQLELNRDRVARELERDGVAREAKRQRQEAESQRLIAKERRRDAELRRKLEENTQRAIARIDAELHSRMQARKEKLRRQDAERRRNAERRRALERRRMQAQRRQQDSGGLSTFAAIVGGVALGLAGADAQPAMDTLQRLATLNNANSMTTGGSVSDSCTQAQHRIARKHAAQSDSYSGMGICGATRKHIQFLQDVRRELAHAGCPAYDLRQLDQSISQSRQTASAACAGG